MRSNIDLFRSNILNFQFLIGWLTKILYYNIKNMSNEDRNLLLRLPSDYGFKPEEFWANLINVFTTSVANQDKFQIQKCLYQFEYYTTIAKQYLTTSSEPNVNIEEKKKSYMESF